MNRLLIINVVTEPSTCIEPETADVMEMSDGEIAWPAGKGMVSMVVTVIGMLVPTIADGVLEAVGDS